MQLYQCKTCGEHYPFVDMAKDSSKETGLKNFCLKCVREYNRSNSVVGKSIEEMRASIDHGAVTLHPGDPGFAEMAAQCTHIKDIPGTPSAYRSLPNGAVSHELTVSVDDRRHQREKQLPVDSVISG